jgi:hypothetical protein
MSSLRLDRRSFIKSAGLSLALPSLESFFAGAAKAATLRAATTASGDPLRMAFVYAPNGVIGENWFPKGVGAEYELNASMQALGEFKQDFSIVSGLEHKHGWAGGDGGGDHARASATILTGARPKKTAGADIRAGVSVDQIAARQVEGLTRFASLELSCDAARAAGTCDSGYSCAYQHNISWRSATQPVGAESNPRLAFERLFVSGAAANDAAQAELRKARESSLLDFIAAEAKSLQKQLGRSDRNKLDEYLTGVREIEQRIQNAEKFGPLPTVGDTKPDGIPGSYRDHVRLMFDILALAFQTDSTRISTFLLAHDGSNRSFQEIGVSEGHHHLSHHQDDPKKKELISRIDRFYIEQFAYFLKRLRDTREANGKSILDNSMIVFCSGLSDGNKHSHDNLPVIVAGRGGGALQPGSHLKASSPQPMTNLYMNLLRNFGAPVERIGDSSGFLSEI